DANYRAASDILVSALGGGNALANGTLNLNASGTVLVGCQGFAYLDMGTNGQTADIQLCSSLHGSITICHVLPGTSSIRMETTPSPTLDMECGDPHAGGATIELTPNSIKLAVGPANMQSSLEMGLQGITLKFGQWSLTMNGGGITQATDQTTSL